MAKEIVNKKYIRYILLLFCVLISIAFIFSFFKTVNRGINPVNGVLDLKNWESDRDGVLRLNGQWDFYWERLLSHQEVTADSPKPDLTVDVPSIWNSYKINGKGLPGFGYGTYLLKVINATVGKPLALRMPTFSTAYELYIDDRLVSQVERSVWTKSSSHPD